MTLPHILLVTGSRALEDTPDAAAWGRGIVGESVRALASNAVVAAGDATGPDAWAIGEARMSRLTWTRFDLDGMLVRSSGQRRPWSMAGERESTPRKVWPLRRNEAMVLEIAAAVASGRYTASALALRAPWARTNGAAHTTTLCMQHNVAYSAHTCPSEYGPQSVMVRP